MPQPQTHIESRRRLRAAGVALAGALVVAVAAHVGFTLPGTDIPQTGQTLAVLAVGGICGTRLGAAAMTVYLVAGAVGLPVFAGRGAGIEALTGPTGGFLFGFVPAAVLAAGATRRSFRFEGDVSRLLTLTAGMLVAHAVILFSGWCRLALLTGPASAFDAGVAPFLWGALAKSVAAAIVVGFSRRFSGPGAWRAT